MYTAVYSSVYFLHSVSSLGALHVFLSSLITPVMPLRTCHRQQHAALHRAISSAQVTLGIIKPLVAPNHGSWASSLPLSHKVVFFLPQA